MSTKSDSDRCIATVQGVKIWSSEVSREAARMQNGTSTDEDLPLRAMENIIDSILICDEARRLSLLPSDKPAAGCDSTAPRQVSDSEIRAQAAEKLLQHWVKGIKLPGKPERKAYFESHREHFRRPETIHAKHVVTKDEQKAEAMRARLIRGEDFALVAQQDSDCPEKGGDLGYFAKGVMVDEFDEVVFQSPVGELTPVFQTPFGFHVALVMDRKPAVQLRFEEADEEISEMLLLLKQDRVVGERMDVLRRRAVIDRNPQ